MSIITTEEKYKASVDIINLLYHLVTIRWYGESNGYYSERVEFEKVSK